MKAVTCEFLCLQIEESNLGWEPDGVARTHLQECASCQSFYEERTRLRQLVGSLGTVAAPADFDFRLRARLASERTGMPGRFGFVGLSFGLRSAAVATLVLVLSAAFVFRFWGDTTKPNVAEISNAQATQSEQKDLSPSNKDQLATVVSAEEPEPPVVNVKSQRAPDRRRGPIVAVANRTATKDFSSSAAPVVRREDQVANAAIFPIDAPSESLKVSLDDASGVSRTIFLPRVSFGSQRLIATDRPIATKTIRSDW